LAEGAVESLKPNCF